MSFFLNRKKTAYDVRISDGSSDVCSSDLLATAKGAALEGAQAQHPFAERIGPVILGEHVTQEAGTGLVHTAPAHGVEDYAVGKLYKLPVDNPEIGRAHV